MSLEDDLGLPPGYTVVYDLTPSAPFLAPALDAAIHDLDARIDVCGEKIALAFRVPYWLIVDRPRPRWHERPVWRLRAIWWSR